MQKEVRGKWAELLSDEFGKPYFKHLERFVDAQYQTKTCYPPQDKVFEAFRLCPFEKLKVVLLGQDPYHEPGQAMGLSFSVPMGMKLPPSLRNIFKELMDDTGCALPFGGDLTAWAEQGVLLLNTTLTVEKGKAGAHFKQGWETFTDNVISIINQKKSCAVFLLWGNYAQQKRKLIDGGKHLILESPHPSPLSAYHGFFGNHHFTKANAYLRENNMEPINW
ncbi:MAG: uracil-DNA glycosylase [Bacteroidaceae bacterium]|jgi:uracil-DNA glycosylase|nr:uracil-DNA glycosylase [Bacteroidaceae bacterium]